MSLDKASVKMTGANFIKSLFYDLLAAVFYAPGLILFAAHAGFTPGGLTGIVLIIHHFLPWPIGTLSFLLNIPLGLLALRILGWRFILRTFQTIAISSLTMDLVMPYFPYYTGSPLLAAIFAGALTGIGLALVYRSGSSTGGTDLILLSLRKLRPHFSAGQLMLSIDACIIISGGIVFQNIDAVLYGFIYSTTLSIVIDKIMYGFVSGKLCMIISNQADRIAELIGQQVRRGSTLIPVEGGFTHEPRKLVLTAINKRQAAQLRQLVKEIDPAAIMIVTEYNETYGQGFQSWSN